LFKNRFFISILGGTNRTALYILAFLLFFVVFKNKIFYACIFLNQGIKIMVEGNQDQFYSTPSFSFLRKPYEMNNSSPKHFYLFKGGWYERFIDLMELMKIDQQQRFVIWEPQDRNKDHNLIILYGVDLPDYFCFLRQIWKTNESVFDAFYRQHIDRYNLHSNYNPGVNVEGGSALLLENRSHLISPDCRRQA
jgi:hypothetical protein